MKIKEKSMIFLIIIILLVAIILFLYNRKLKDEIDKLEISNNELSNLVSVQEESNNKLSNLISEQEEKIKNIENEDVTFTVDPLNDGSYEEIKIDNVKPNISKERAREIVEDICKNITGDGPADFHFIETKEEKINFEEKAILIENTFLLRYPDEIDRVRPLNMMPKKVQKNVYAVYYATDDELDKMTAYIDMYTGEFLGVYQEGI